MVSYTNLPNLKAATVPIVPTGAGALAITNATDATAKDARTIDKELYYMARASARGFFIRVISSFLFATGLLSFLAFLSCIDSNDQPKMFITALSVVINTVAVMHYKLIGKLREGKGPLWLGQIGWFPYEGWNETRAIAIEIMVDALRYSDWLITMMLLVTKIYAIINRPFADYSGPFASVETAVAVAALMILIGAFARIGTDESWDFKRPVLACFGYAAYAVSLTCMVLLLWDLGNATQAIHDGYLFRSFFYVWIGYPGVALCSMLWRLWYARCSKAYPDQTYQGEFPEALSLFKDLSFGLLDVWSKGVFAMWTAYTVFGKTLFNNDPADPLEWAR